MNKVGHFLEKFYVVPETDLVDIMADVGFRAKPGMSLDWKMGSNPKRGYQL